MHDYAIFSHDRTSIGRWLGVLSIFILSAISQIFIEIYKLTGYEAFIKASISAGVIYFILHYFFNNYMWKLGFFKIPDLSGEWEIIGETLNEDGSCKYKWDANIGIEQNWKKIVINLKTSNSQSFSQTATLEKQHGLESWLLSYSYKNEPKIHQSHELNAHKGYCQIEFNKDITTGNASYFNNNGRRTFGQMELNKVKND